MMTKEGDLNSNWRVFSPPCFYPALISSVGCRIWALSSADRASCWVRRKWRAAPISSTVIIAGWVSRRGVSWRKRVTLRPLNPTKTQHRSPICTFMFATLVPKAFFIQAMRSSACSCVKRSEAARGPRVRTTAAAVLSQWRYEGGADLACGPQTSPPCSGPPQCRSPPRSSSFCRTPGGAAG